MHRHSLAFATLVAASLGSFASAAPFHSNLLVNPSATAGLAGWDFSTASQSWAVGSVSQDGDGASFNSSFLGTMSQQVDLIAAGFSPAELDASPTISFGGWGTAGGWAEDLVTIHYRLKDSSNSTIDSYYSPENLLPLGQWIPMTWQTTLPVGTRYAEMTYSVADTEFWAGYYGAIIDSTLINIPEPTSLTLLGAGALTLLRRRNRASSSSL